MIAKNKKKTCNMFILFEIILTKIKIYIICYANNLYIKMNKKQFLTVKLVNNFNFFKIFIFHKSFIIIFKFF